MIKTKKKIRCTSIFFHEGTISEHLSKNMTTVMIIKQKKLN